LQVLLGDCAERTIRRYLKYLEYVGFLARLSGQGSRDGLRVRLCVETAIGEINDRIEVIGQHHAFFRPTHLGQDCPMTELSDVASARTVLSDVAPTTSRKRRTETSEVASTSDSSERSEPVAPVALHTHARARARVNLETVQDSVTSLTPGLKYVDKAKALSADAKPRRPGTETSKAIASLVDAMREEGFNRYQPSGRDVGAIKRMPGLVADNAHDIACCYSDIAHKRYGRDYLREGLSIHRIINDWLPGYQVWVADGRPPPQPEYANGRSKGSSHYTNFGGPPEHYRSIVIGEEDDDDGKEAG